MGCMPGLAKVVCGIIAMLRFPGVVRGTTTPLTPCKPRRVTMPISYPSEQGTLLTSFLISRQAVAYQTCGDTYCPGVSTPKTRSLVDLSNLPHRSKSYSNHKIEPHHGHLTSRQMEDQHSQHSPQVKLNIIKMERHVRHS
jgi:hypothetical protein